MNRAIKITAAVLMFAFAARVSAEDLSVPDIIKAAEQPAVQSTELAAKIAKVREDMKKIITSMEASQAEIKSLRNELKLLDDKVGEIKVLALEIGVIKSRITSLENRFNEELSDIRKASEEFDSLKESLERRTAAMKSWDDIIGVMKKQTGNTEMEIAGIKKEIKELRRQYAGGDDVIGSIVSWPYMGITALIISIAALIAAVAR